MNYGHDGLGRVTTAERVWNGVTTTAYSWCGSCAAVTPRTSSVPARLAVDRLRQLAVGVAGDEGDDVGAGHADGDDAARPRR